MIAEGYLNIQRGTKNHIYMKKITDIFNNKEKTYSFETPAEDAHSSPVERRGDGIPCVAGIGSAVEHEYQNLRRVHNLSDAHL